MDSYLEKCSDSSFDLCFKTASNIQGAKLKNITKNRSIGHILYNVAWDDFPRVLDTFEAFGGNIFLTDKNPDEAGFPIYLDDEKLILARKSSGNCGCSDIDECATEIHDCPEHSTCVNNYAGFSCECDKERVYFLSFWICLMLF